MIRTPPFPRRVIIWLLTSFIISMLLWSFVGEIDVVITAEGKVVADGYTKSVQSAVGGTVRKINVKEGDLVKVGDALIELDTRISEADLTAIHEKINQAKGELARLMAERAGKSAKYDASLNVNKRETQNALRQFREATHSERTLEAIATMASKRSEIDAGNASLEGLERRYKIAKEKEEKARPFVDVAISRFQYLQWKDDLEMIEREMATLRRTSQRLQHELEATSSKLKLIYAERQAEIWGEINDREVLITQMESELAKAEKRSSDNVISAPVDGYVQKVNITTIGATVNTSESILTIVPKDIALLIEAILPNEDKGFAREGQHVDIKLDAFPFQKYGKIQGTLLWISPDGEEFSANKSFRSSREQTQSSGFGLSQTAYRAKIRPWISNKLRLTPGMTVKVDIFTDRRRIIDFFLFPLIAATEESMRVR